MRKLNCRICNAEFFSDHSQAKYCSKNCSHEGEKISWRKYGQKNKEKVKIKSRKHYEQNKSKRNIQIKEWQHSEKGRISACIRDKHMRNKFPEKYHARLEVNKALKRGDLIKQPCSICGNGVSQAHHPDYSKPLNIIWLCDMHHKEIHRKGTNA